MEEINEKERLEQKSSELQKEIRKHTYDMAYDKDSAEEMKKVVEEKRKELLKTRVALALANKASSEEQEVVRSK